MLIAGVPLQVRIEQLGGTFLTYTSVESIPSESDRAKVQKIVDSVIKVSKITIKMS